jgi:UDP-N-acetylmuramoyl-tripeptide--D-alanyl-D-alanine ligase
MCRVMPLWTSHDIAAATGGRASQAFDASGVAFDSREVETGHLFLALTGETTDGHHFVDSAIAQGASGLLVSQPVAHPHILVADTTQALDALGRAARARTAAVIIGVTGSVGKTGTKEALSAALARGNKGSVHRSVKSYNNHTGVPLSLARMPAQTGYGVFEMGMNHAGELLKLTKLVRPNIALITTVAAVHLEYFGSVDAIADAKGEIFAGLEPGGTAIIPFDLPHYGRLMKCAAPFADNILTFGRGAGATVRLLDAMPVAGGTLMSVALPAGELSFTLSHPGDHWVSNALGILAAVYAAGGDLAAAGLALAELEQIAGRGARHIIKVADGEVSLIDESYNANPTSMAATLSVFAGIAADRKIAILGAMGELGAESDALHAGLCPDIEAAGVDFALLVGQGMIPLAQALEGRVACAYVADAAAALERITAMIKGGDALLIKGSNAVGLPRIVAALTGGV